MYVKKITLSLFILCVAFVGAAQQKRKVKYVDISHSNSKETTHTFLDSNGRKISVKQTIFDGFNSIVTYTPTGKKKTTEMNFDGTRDLWTNFYDAHDNLTRLEYYNFINNTRFVASSYTYDNKNRQLTRAEYDGRGQLQNLKTTVYDDVKNTDTSVWSYNLLHQKSISKFDHKGNEVFRELYEGNDTVAYTTFKYDEKNRQIEKKWTKGCQYEILTHRYNKNGDEVSQDWERRWKSDGYALDTGSWDYTYEYDIDGNKTKIHEIKKHNGRVTEDSETFFTYQYY